MTKKTALWIALLALVIAAAWGVSRYGTAPGPDANTEDQGTTTTVPDGTQPTDGWQSYVGDGFAVRYPQGWTADGPYTYEALGPGKGIPGWKFTVPASLTAGTNLSKDTYFSVEKLTGGLCSAASFVDGAIQQGTAEENGRAWSTVKAGGAGAGNLYDETVYAASIDGTCYGLRQFVHSTNIGNYDPGAVEEFDRQSLDTAFAQFRASFMAR